LSKGVEGESRPPKIIPQSRTDGRETPVTKFIMCSLHEQLRRVIGIGPSVLDLIRCLVGLYYSGYLTARHSKNVNQRLLGVNICIIFNEHNIAITDAVIKSRRLYTTSTGSRSYLGLHPRVEMCLWSCSWKFPRPSIYGQLRIKTLLFQHKT